MASRGLLDISKHNISFSYLEHRLFKCTTRVNILIRNIAKENIEFLIRIDELRPNFDIIVENNEHVTKTNVALVIKLDSAKSYISLPFVFTPEKKGSFSATLPIFVKGYMDGRAFNQLELSGFYPAAVLKCPEEIVLRPIPTGESLSHAVNIRAKYHTQNCSFRITCDAPEVVIKYPHGNFISCEEITDNLSAIISFSSINELAVRAFLKVSCDCGAVSEIKFFACAGTWSLTTHIHIFLNNFELLEEEGDTAPGDLITVSSKIQTELYDFRYSTVEREDMYPDTYAQYMDKVCDAIERWIFTQVMYGKYFFTVPDQINDVFVHLKPIETQMVSAYKVCHEAEETLAIVKILMNLAGSEVKNLIISR